jgi:hypothetical protein
MSSSNKKFVFDGIRYPSVKVNDSSKDNKLRIRDCPDRAPPFLFAHKLHHEKNKFTLNDIAYRRFIVEGPTITQGSYKQSTKEKVNCSKRIVFPSQISDTMVHKLQK